MMMIIIVNTFIKNKIHNKKNIDDDDDDDNNNNCECICKE
jgi:uncharacterized membrane protein